MSVVSPLVNFLKTMQASTLIYFCNYLLAYQRKKNLLLQLSASLGVTVMISSFGCQVNYPENYYYYHY